MITLYDHPRSGNCYRVRLFLSLIGLASRRVFVDVLARANHTEAFERVSAFRQVPAIQDGDDEPIWDSHAILLYLAHRYAPKWIAPSDQMGQMHAWISVSTNEIANSLQPLRLTKVVSTEEAAHHLGVDASLLDVAGLERKTHRTLAAFNKRLTEHEWLAVSRSVADVDCYGYLALAEEAGIDIADYPAVAAWRHRIEALPGYVRHGDAAPSAPHDAFLNNP